MAFLMAARPCDTSPENEKVEMHFFGRPPGCAHFIWCSLGISSHDKPPSGQSHKYMRCAYEFAHDEICPNCCPSTGNFMLLQEVANTIQRKLNRAYVAKTKIRRSPPNQK